MIGPFDFKRDVVCQTNVHPLDDEEPPSTVSLLETKRCIGDKPELEVDVQALRREVELHNPREVAWTDSSCLALIEE